MPQIVPREGSLILMGAINDALNSMPSSQLRLFQNNFIPNDDSRLADFVEANFSGYSRVDLTWGGFPILLGDGKAQITADQSPVTFSYNGGLISNIVYGFYVADPTRGKVLWAQRFVGPRQLHFSDPNVVVLVVLSGVSEF